MKEPISPRFISTAAGLVRTPGKKSTWGLTNTIASTCFEVHLRVTREAARPAAVFTDLGVEAAVVTH